MRYVVIVIGAGGTGSFFLKEISRFLMDNHKIESLVIFDGDTVEKKNLARQAFAAEDIGRNKAVVLAECLNEAFGLNWHAYPHFISEEKQISKAIEDTRIRHGECLPIIVSCVDNHGARLVLEKLFFDYKNVAYFDAANEFTTGEVVFSYRVNGETYGPPRSYYFPDILKGDTRSREEMSCEELNKVEPQHIFTNMLAGNLLCSAVSNLLEQKSTPGVAYFNARRYDVRFVPYAACQKAAIKGTISKKGEKKVTRSGRGTERRKK